MSLGKIQKIKMVPRIILDFLQSKGKAKYPLWDNVDKGIFKNLTRGNNPITKTFNGDFEALLESSEILHS